MKNTKAFAWITWEDHRRSRELADAFGAEYVLLQYKGPRWIRYMVLGFRTVSFVARCRERLFFCQNPSIVLAVLLCMLRKPLGFPLVVDRHSNFKPHTKNSWHPKWRVFHALSRWTTRKADLTIVTNDYLARVVQGWGGDAVILQDKLPDLHPTRPPRYPECFSPDRGYSVMCVTSYGDDEPIEDLVRALASMPDVTAYMTGNYDRTRLGKSKDQLEEQGVVLTGFISEQDYVDLMAAVDAVVVLTIRDDILTCGAYEAVSLRKPLVLSDTEVLRNYFGAQPIYVKPTADSIADGVHRVTKSHGGADEVKLEEWVNHLEEEWQERFESVQREVQKLAQC